MCVPRCNMCTYGDSVCVCGVHVDDAFNNSTRTVAARNAIAKANEGRNPQQNAAVAALKEKRAAERWKGLRYEIALWSPKADLRQERGCK